VRMDSSFQTVRMHAGELRPKVTTEFEEYNPSEEMTESIFQTALDDRWKMIIRRDKILRECFILN
jgi:hypothetical protein